MLPALAQLKNIGLTESELKIYEALLKLGESTKTSLAKAAGIAPANLYDVTNRLAEKGIISIVVKNGVKHFSAVHPRHLLDFLDQKRKTVEREEELITALLPSLQAAFLEKGKETRVEVFTGWRGLTTIFEDLLDESVEGDKNFVYGASRGANEQRVDTFFLKYSRMRARKGIMLDIIFNEELRSRRERVSFFLESRHCDVRFLEQHTNTEIMLYNDTAVIIVLAAEPLAIRIRDAQVMQSFKEHFDAMWKQSKP